MRHASIAVATLGFFAACTSAGGDSPNGPGGPGGKGDDPTMTDAGVDPVDGDGDGDAAPVDIYAGARDVDQEIVTFPEGTVAPTSYDYPSGGEFRLSGTEFWQKWSGGKNPTYSFGDGTDAGRLCMQASAIRFEAIMADPPAELVQLAADTNWSGSFFNWNDDYSDPTAWGDGSASRLWAWRTHLIKWISQTMKDGSCLLPTRDLVVRAATACIARGASSEGEIQGCSATN